MTTTAGSGTLTNPRIGDGDASVYYYNYTGTQTKLDYTYSGNGVITTTTFYRECNSNVGSTPGSGVFTRVDVTPSSADLQNYRNWYTYYRTRSLTMRSAASLAFQPINDRYRVGFSTIINQYVNGTGFLDVSDFNAGQKSSFYTALFGANPNNSTPLRGALSKAGKYFAKKGTLSGGGAQTYDPVQYSCQRNFAILTTDGYWNNNDETSSYGPLGLYGTNVGQQDGQPTARPLFDGDASILQSRTSNLQQSSIITPGAAADQHQHAADADAHYTGATAAEHQHPAAVVDHRAVEFVDQHSASQHRAIAAAEPGQRQLDRRLDQRDPVHLEQQYAVPLCLERICQCRRHLHKGRCGHEHEKQHHLERPGTRLPVHGMDAGSRCHDDLHGGEPIDRTDQLHTAHGDPVQRVAAPHRYADQRHVVHDFGDGGLRLHGVVDTSQRRVLHGRESVDKKSPYTVGTAVQCSTRACGLGAMDQRGDRRHMQHIVDDQLPVHAVVDACQFGVLHGGEPVDKESL